MVITALPSQADVVVVGGGALGASVTFHLTRAGLKVVLVEKSQPGTQTSSSAAGMVMQIQANDVLTELSTRSRAMLTALDEATCGSLALHRTGSVKLTIDSSSESQIEAELSRGRAVGVAVERITPERAESLIPWLDARKARAAWYAPDDLYLDPLGLVKAYLCDAETKGAVVVASTEVIGIEASGGSLEAVITARGRVAASTAVIAAGAWSRALASRVGLELPLVPIRHQIGVTTALGVVDRWHPTVRVIEARGYARPSGSALMVGGFGERPSAVNPETLSSTIDVRELRYDADAVIDKMKRLAHLIPALRDARLANVRGGMPTMTPDGMFLADKAPNLEGLFVLAGCNSGGLSTSPALGHDLSRWIIERTKPISLAAFSLSRFPHPFIDDEQLKAACIRTYLHKYTPSEGDATTAVGR